MPGTPVKNRLRAELEQRTRAAFPDSPEATHLDYVADWQSQGKFMTTLAKELGVSVSFLREYVRLTYGANAVREALTRAREEGAHALAEEATELADKATAEDVQVRRLQVQSRQWLTEKWNRREFGQDKGVSVNVNIGQLALAALQAPPPPVPAAIEQSAIVPAIADDAEVLSITDSSTSDGE